MLDQPGFENATLPTAPKVHVPEEWQRGTAGPRAAAPQVRGTGLPKSILVLGALAVLAVTAAAASITWRMTQPDPVATPTATATPAPKPPPPPPPPPPPEKKTVAAPAKVEEPEPPAPPMDLRQCLAELLPEDGLPEKGPSLKGVCEKKSDYGAMLVLKTEIVRHGGHIRVTPAMAEWSRLGWYETAAFAAMRSRCCPDASALKSPTRFESCRMEESLAYIANAVGDEDAMTEALEDYRRAATCVARKGGAGAYGRLSLPGKAEQVYVRRILKRMKTARKK